MPKSILDTIAELERDQLTYRNLCSYKLKEYKDPCYRPLKKCVVCNGYSSVSECPEFFDIMHLINFHKKFSLSLPEGGVTDERRGN